MKKLTTKKSNKKINFIDSIKDLMNSFNIEDLSKIKIYGNDNITLSNFLKNSTSDLERFNSKDYWENEILSRLKKITRTNKIPKKWESRENLKSSGFLADIIHFSNIIQNQNNYYSPHSFLKWALEFYSVSSRNQLPEFIQKAINEYEWDLINYSEFYKIIRSDCDFIELLKALKQQDAIKIQLHLYYDPETKNLTCSKRTLKTKFVKVSTLTFSESNKKNYYSKAMKNYLDSKNKEEFLTKLIKESLNSFYKKQLENGINTNIKMSDFISGKVPFLFVSDDDDIKDWMSKTNSKGLKSAFLRLSEDLERSRFKKLFDEFLTSP